ncbi:hypothetical protein DRZ78_04470 [Candidatus Aerophobetes bacterium]|uniref:Uncharacterized protein n=1 Tax=Aerophobetes bacterium TaxID=2030807 RepID=A0A662CZC1_UNCAE|nr:MAG: hypothetical protein DRZ78_04470 [Candidatus Aerophobetes bacterium]
MQLKNFEGKTTMEKYQQLAFRVNLVFTFAKALFDKKELQEFLDYVEQVDTVLPLVNPEVWNNHYQDIEKAKKRVKALLNIMDVE